MISCLKKVFLMQVAAYILELYTWWPRNTVCALNFLNPCLRISFAKKTPFLTFNIFKIQNNLHLRWDQGGSRTWLWPKKTWGIPNQASPLYIDGGAIFFVGTSKFGFFTWLKVEKKILKIWNVLKVLDLVVCKRKSDNVSNSKIRAWLA